MALTVMPKGLPKVKRGEGRGKRDRNIRGRKTCLNGVGGVERRELGKKKCIYIFGRRGRLQRKSREKQGEEGRGQKQMKTEPHSKEDRQ